jgi:hypothetical protein
MKSATRFVSIHNCRLRGLLWSFHAVLCRCVVPPRPLCPVLHEMFVFVLGVSKTKSSVYVQSGTPSARSLVRLALVLGAEECVFGMLNVVSVTSRAVL